MEDAFKIFTQTLETAILASEKQKEGRGQDSQGVLETSACCSNDNESNICETSADNENQTHPTSGGHTNIKNDNVGKRTNTGKRSLPVDNIDKAKKIPKKPSAKKTNACRSPSSVPRQKSTKQKERPKRHCNEYDTLRNDDNDTDDNITEPIAVAELVPNSKRTTTSILYVCTFCNSEFGTIVYDVMIEHCQQHIIGSECGFVFHKEFIRHTAIKNGSNFSKLRVDPETAKSKIMDDSGIIQFNSITIINFNYEIMKSGNCPAMFESVTKPEIDKIRSSSIYKFTRAVLLTSDDRESSAPFMLFKCIGCEKYVDPYSIVSHIQENACDKMSKGYICCKCSSEFLTENAMYQHNKTHDVPNVNCKYKQVNFNDPRYFYENAFLLFSAGFDVQYALKREKIYDPMEEVLATRVAEAQNSLSDIHETSAGRNNDDENYEISVDDNNTNNNKRTNTGKRSLPDDNTDKAERKTKKPPAKKTNACTSPSSVPRQKSTELKGRPKRHCNEYDILRNDDNDNGDNITEPIAVVELDPNSMRTTSILYVCTFCNSEFGTIVYDVMIEHCQDHMIDSECGFLFQTEIIYHTAIKKGSYFSKLRVDSETAKSKIMDDSGIIQFNSITIINFNYEIMKSGNCPAMFESVTKPEIDKIRSSSIYNFTRFVIFTSNDRKSSAPYTLFECMCCEKYVDPYSIISHIQANACDKMSTGYLCCKCSRKFLTENYMHEHYKTHNMPNVDGNYKEVRFNHPKFFFFQCAFLLLSAGFDVQYALKERIINDPISEILETRVAEAQRRLGDIHETSASSNNDDESDIHKTSLGNNNTNNGNNERTNTGKRSLPLDKNDKAKRKPTKPSAKKTNACLSPRPEAQRRSLRVIGRNTRYENDISRNDDDDHVDAVIITELIAGEELVPNFKRKLRILYVCTFCNPTFGTIVYDAMINHCQEHAIESVRGFPLHGDGKSICILAKKEIRVDADTAYSTILDASGFININSITIINCNYERLKSGDCPAIFETLTKPEIDKIRGSSIYNFTRIVRLTSDKRISSAPFMLFKCTRCEKYVDPYSIVSHVQERYRYKACSTESVGCFCSKCGREFLTESAMYQHYKTHAVPNAKWKYKEVIFNQLKHFYLDAFLLFSAGFDVKYAWQGKNKEEPLAKILATCVEEAVTT